MDFMIVFFFGMVSLVDDRCSHEHAERCIVILYVEMNINILVQKQF